MWQKIIDDCSNIRHDLFEIKSIFLPSKSYIATFSIWVDATLFSISGFKQFSPYRRNISSNQKRLFFVVSLYPLSFFANIFYFGGHLGH